MTKYSIIDLLGRIEYLKIKSKRELDYFGKKFMGDNYKKNKLTPLPKI